MPQATSFDSILEQCRDLVCQRVADALAKMLDGADAAITAFEAGAHDPETKKLYQVTRNKVLAQRDTIVTQFRMRFLREFQERSNKVKKIGDKFDEIDLSSLELELVAEDDLDESLKFNAMASRVRQYCDEELAALDQRVGVLIGDADLQSEDNPFTPEAICDAYKQTCRQVDSNVDVRMVLLKLFDDHVLDEMRAVYKAINALLIENSILPKIRFSVARGKDGAKVPPAGQQQNEQAAGGVARVADRAPGNDQDLFAQLQTLLAGNLKGLAQQGGAAAAGQTAEGGAALPSAELLGSLTRIQHGDISGMAGAVLPPAVVAGTPVTTNVLQELKSTSLGSGMNQMDAMTLDIMAMLFDELFDDPKIPNSVKGLIGRLQIPMLKVAIADKSFFSRKTHPARRMLDKLGELSAGLPADISDSDSIYAKLESLLQDLIEGFEDDVKIFDDLLKRLDVLIAEASERIEEKTQSIAKQVEQEESLALAKTVAQAEIKVRVRASAGALTVIEFLAQQWVKLLIVIHVKEGEESEAWKAALETAELLLWSSEPKETIAERQQLVGLLPGLLKRVSAGLNHAGIDDEIRVKFLTDLRKLHSQIIGSSAEPKSEAPSAAPAINDTHQQTQTDVESSERDVSEEPEAPGASVDPEGSMAVSESKDHDVADDSVDAATDAEPDEPESISKAGEAETSVEVIELDSLAMPESNDVEDKTTEPGVVATPVEGESGAIAGEQEVGEPAPTTPAAKPQESELPSLALEFEVTPNAPVDQKSAPADQESAPAHQESAPAGQDAVLAEKSPADTQALNLELEAAPTDSAPALSLDLDAAPAQSEAAPPEAATPAASTEETPKDEASEDPGLLTMQFAAAAAAKAAAAPNEAAKPAASSEETAKDEASEDPGLLTMQFAAAAAAKAADAPTEAATPAASIEETPKQEEESEDPGLLTMDFTRASAKSAQTVPAPAAKASAPKTSPTPTKATPPVSPSGKNPASQPAAPAQTKNTQPKTVSPAATPAVPKQPAKPVVARSGRAPTQTAQSVAAKAVKSRALREGAGAHSDSVDLNAPVVLKNPFGDGEVQVNDLDFTDFSKDNSAKAGTGKVSGAKLQADHPVIPKDLAEGSWVEIREKGESDKAKRAKLSIVSPLKNRFVFVTRQGRTVLDCSRAELARRFLAGEVVLSTEEAEASLFDRLAGGLVGKLGGNKS